MEKKVAHLTILILLLGSAGYIQQYLLYEPTSSALTLALLMILAAGIISLITIYRERAQPRGWHRDTVPETGI